MKRHAYLILAHRQWDLLKILIHLIDDNRNDIYLHIDKKVKDAPINEIQSCAQQSKLILVDRISVYRGTFSLFEAEMILVKRALREEREYSYFHLLSGQDLPLKNQDYIHSFFEHRSGYNFIDIVPRNDFKGEWYERVSLYQYLSRYSLSDSRLVSIPAKCCRKMRLLA